jgi:glycosyltransferase involved in cell wall biosynthesis
LEHGVEAILAQWMDPTLPLVDLSIKLGIRYYCQTHGLDATIGLKDAEVRRAYQRYNAVAAVISPSEFGRQQLLQLGIKAERTRVMRHGVKIPNSPIVRKAGAVRCLASGRMDPMKGPMLILDAFRRALQACPDLTLDYVGEGALMPAVQQLTRAFQVQNRVTFHRFMPHEKMLQLMK